jgi:formyl-CoA transferase
VGLPSKFSAFPPAHRRPLLGEHSTEVLTELGYTAEQINNLSDAHIIAEHA